MRERDIVLFGATGFTGGLTAEYLARHAPDGLRWALAGRRAGRLAAVRNRLAAIDPGLAGLDLLEADVTDAGSLRPIVESTRVIATTVGPYLELGEQLVAACAAAGTDYLDLTGEPEFVDRMYVRHHAAAVATGARLIHASGFDSVPHDLGALFTVEQLPEGVPLTVRGYVRAGGRPSAGTYHTAITAMARIPQASVAQLERRRVEPRSPRRVASDKRPLRYERSLGALERYGPDFSYGHYAAFEQLPVAVGAIGGTAALFALSQLPPTRAWLRGRMRSGEGPSAERRARSWFNVRFVGEGGGRRVVTEVAGGDPGYEETAKMLAESALCLAGDELPPSAGQVTPAVAMGDALIERLRRQGISFRVLEAS